MLLIREHMATVPEGGVLEMRSRESTVRDDLPPWCRMVGHEFLGELSGPGCARYFVRKGAGQAARAEAQALEQDKARARDYEWRVRVRSTGHLKSTAYFRNFTLDLGQPASFEETDAYPSAVEVLLGSLGGALSTAFASECAREGLEVDDVEISVRGRLHDPLAPLGLGAGDPAFAGIEVKAFASTLDEEARVRAAWERTLARSPLLATLAKATEVSTRLGIV